MRIVEMCQTCYGTHYTEAEKQRCTQAQMQQDANPPRLFSPRAMKRYADACHWCGSIHTTPAERARCMLDNCG